MQRPCASPARPPGLSSPTTLRLQRRSHQSPCAGRDGAASPTAPFPCPALSVAMETCIRSEHQRSRLFSCCPLGPNPISVSISGELCLSVGLPGMARSWLPRQRACESQHGAGGCLDPSFGFKGSICGPSRGSGGSSEDRHVGCRSSRLLKPPLLGCLTTERGRGTLLGGPRGGRPTREHGKNARWQQRATRTCCRHLHSPAGGLGPPGEGRGAPTLRGLERERAGPADGVGWPQAVGHVQGRGLGQKKGPHRNN